MTTFVVFADKLKYLWSIVVHFVKKQQFYSSCLCGLPFNGKPIRHFLNECNITIHIFKFIKNQSNQSNQRNATQYSTTILICPPKSQTSSFILILPNKLF